MKHADKVDANAIVNRSLQKTKVEDKEETNDQHPMEPTRSPRGTLEKTRITGGSAMESSGKKNPNGTVNPRGIVQFFDN